jgi:hypothetical protein
MRSWKKTTLIVVAVFIVAVVSYALYIWNKPARDVSKETGIRITAMAIFDSFTNNEQVANQSFLSKAIEVTGKVADVKKNQAGKTVVYLESSDPIYGVNCTFKDDPGAIAKGTTITFKGVCTGFLSDVVINDGVLVK